jgi:uroporphyrin-III C-methyltransferase
VSFVTPSVGEGEAPNHAWIEAARGADTVAVYMGAGQLPALAAALVVAGKPAATPLATVANASLPQQRIWRGTLGSVAEAVLEAGVPVMVLIGAPAQGRQAQAPEAPAPSAMEHAA